MTIQAGIRGLVIAAALAAAAAAHAHAHLDRASPAAGATLAVAPTEVTLHFTQQLEPKFSTIVVRDAAGKQVDKGDSHVSGEDLSVLKVSLQPLGAAGMLRAAWSPGGKPDWPEADVLERETAAIRSTPAATLTTGSHLHGR